ncbi:efflux RND transporter periplasmic adaptor subunit [Pseudophaeobacter sp. 1A16562]|uniref:efflux RND transporter periplasmic adaptor subunit n=1 Tax=Pseudophaeobacter sp. 1A16562 TaxID=3098143 RepID=UPI0034D4E784
MAPSAIMLRFLTVLLVAGATFAYLASDLSAPSAKPTYVTAPVEFGRLEETVSSTGTVDALFTVDISSQVSGRITKVTADFNDSVESGQPLAQIDRQGFEARVAEAEAAVSIALSAVEVRKAALTRSKVEIDAIGLERSVHQARVDKAKAEWLLAQSNLDRKEGLHRSGTVSEADIDNERTSVLTASAALREAEALMAVNEQRIETARADFARNQAELAGARANVPQRQAALKLAEVELERTTIRAPIDGVIINRSIEEGQTVAAALEAPTLFTIAKALRNMVVYVSVDETDIGRIRIGQAAGFTVDAFPDRMFSGVVTEIRKSAKVIQNIVTYTVVLETENPEELLLPGMTAFVKITIKRSEPGLKVPTNALSYTPSTYSGTPETTAVIWRLDELGKPEPMAVVPLDSDASHTLIASEEIEEGDLVIGAEIEQPHERSLFGNWIGARL